MAKSKKISLFIFSVLLALSSFLFSACGNKDYSKTYLSSSEESISLFVDEEKTVSITINDPVSGMSKLFQTPFVTNSNICQVVESAHNGYTTTYTITGKSGGQTSVTFVALDGGASVTINVSVRQFSDSFEATKGSLYVSQSGALIPSSNDFEFDSNTSEYDLTYYYSGTNIPNAEDIEEYYEFVKIELIKVDGATPGEKVGKLQFTNSENEVYYIKTNGEETTTLEEGFDVNAGDKLNFLAKYISNNANELFVARSFFVLDDIEEMETEYILYAKIGHAFNESVSSSYTDKGLDEVIFVPNYTDVDGTDFLTVHTKVLLPKENDLLKVEVYAENTNIVTGVADSLVPGEREYRVRLNCANGAVGATNYVYHFYYEGFKNSTDPNVSYYHKIPVRTRIIPKDIMLNDVPASTITLNFYNHYAEGSGWQKFNLNVTPLDSEYTSLSFTLPDGLMARYKGQTYQNSETINIDDIVQPLYLKGKEGATVVASGTIILKLGIDVFGPDEIEKSLDFDISEGATGLTLASKYEDGVYVDSKSTTNLVEDILSADKEFRSVTITHVGEEDIASIAYSKNGTNISLTVSPKGNILGQKIGLYKVALDNGIYSVITVKVIETLEDIFVETEDINGLLNYIPSRDATEFYILNGEDEASNYIDLHVYSNGSKDSRAIETVDYQLESNPTFSIFGQNASGRDFNVRIADNGKSSDFKIIAKGYSVASDCTLESKEIMLDVTLYAYSFIDGLQITKLKDGKNENTNINDITVYTGVNNAERRQVVISVDAIGEGYLFADPADSFNYLPETFNKKFIYFEIEGAADNIHAGNREDSSTGIGAFKWDETRGQLSFIANGGLANPTEVGLRVHVMQFNKRFTQSLTIKIDKYDAVQGITLQEAIDDEDGICFSATLTKYSTVAFPTNEKYSNGEIIVLPESVPIKDGEKMFNEGDIVSLYDEITGKTYITFKLNTDFIAKATGGVDSGYVLFVAKDWVQDGNLLPEYEDGDYALKILINYENGTEGNRYSIKSTQEFAEIKNDLSAHYSIKGNIDVSSIKDMFPLGELTGSIIGETEFAKISGIEIDKVESENVGIFSSIASGAYIEYLSFEGKFNFIATTENAKVGLIAGVNKGTLKNVGVTLTGSCEMNGGNLGGLVGINEGTICQDYSVFDVINNNIIEPDDIFEGLSPKTMLYMSNKLTVNTPVTTNIGGLAGYNKGTISKKSGLGQYTGITNYMSFAYIEQTGINTSTLGSITGLNEGQIKGEGYTTPYVAGDGIIVGGRLKGVCSVGGIAGSFIYSSGRTIEGVTTRVFVRSASAVAVFVNAPALSGISNLKAQAVDDCNVGIDASMIVLEHATLGDSYNNLNKVGFGPYTNVSGFEGNFVSYVDRTDLCESLAYPIVISSNNTNSYYGDFAWIKRNTMTDKNEVHKHYLFDKATDTGFGVEENFDNQMEGIDKKVFYAYYFDIQSFAANVDEDEAWLNRFNQTLNTLSSTHEFYPFRVNNMDVIFNSLNEDILYIDSNGVITIYGTGLAQIQAKSLLNLNDGLNFYIYVTRYFNNNNQLSIIYPNTSNNSTALDEVTLYMRGDNEASLYIRPQYNLKEGSLLGERFKPQKDGRAYFDNIAFNLALNTEITAEIEVDIDNFVYELNEQNIVIIRKPNVTPADGEYSLKIKPVLSCKIGEDTFKVNVNKYLENMKVDYRRGAISIATIHYDEVPIFSGSTVEEVVVIKSTASDEEEPIYKVVDQDGKETQLFDVNFVANLDLSADSHGYYEHRFHMTISVNKTSNEYINRYTNDIYGKYRLILIAHDNSTVTTSIIIKLTQTEVVTPVIDNYTLLKEATANNGLPSQSDNVHPGESGLIAITVTPEDADYDSILIENSALNYEEGHSRATFTLLARRANATGSEELFDAKTIAGKQTATGIKVDFEEIKTIYSGADYVSYNGIIYIRYDFVAQNVLNNTISQIDVKFVRDGVENGFVSKPLTMKLQHFVGIELVEKTKLQESGYYSAYEVARGLEYEIRVNSYGYSQENITIAMDKPQMGEIVKREDGKYYLVINQSAIAGEYFEITVSGKATVGETERVSSSKTQIKVKNFVFNYPHTENDKNPDIVTGMGNGIINVQIGTKTVFAIDLFSYMEYNPDDASVVNSINAFMTDLATNGTWTAITNLVSLDQPDFNKADPEKTDGARQITIGGSTSGANYFFRHNGLEVTPVHTHLPEEEFYYFTFSAKYKSTSVGYEVDNSAENIVSTKFLLNVFTSSSEESPIPVYDYNDFTKMQRGGYYILLNDIVLPNEDSDDGVIKAFIPQNATFASFDGNGHTITFSGNYDLGSESNIGLFASLASGSVVKNLNVNFATFARQSFDDNINKYKNYNLYEMVDNVQVPLETVKFITSSENFAFGSLVAENSGIITNCNVFGLSENKKDVFVSVIADNGLQRINHMGGLVGTNSGFITNSSVKINIKSPFYISGFVSRNNGKIAASSFGGGKLIGVLSYHEVAGFVHTNSESAQIVTSFTSGEKSSSSIYSKQNPSIIKSTQPSSGFVMNNEGTIKDCYADIDLRESSSSMSGFVMTNSGLIRNSFSLSILVNNNTSSAGFAMSNSKDGAKGTLENCFYYYDNDTDKINVSLVKVDDTYGIKKYNSTGFATLSNFEDYSYSAGIDYKGVWFFSTGSSSTFYEEFKATANKSSITIEGKTQTNTIYEKQPMALPMGRLELVSANISSLSIRNFDYSEKDAETGDIKYYYVDDSLTPARGSLHNPRLISTAQNMESEITENTSSLKLNTVNYRLLADIDYGTFEGYSKIYKVIYAGNLEGNGMKINQIGIVSMDNLDNGGMFAQIGYSNDKTGSIKNLTISPREVAFSGATSVGTLAGSVAYGNIYDVTVTTADSGGLTVLGKHFVGGIIGRAVSKYDIKDVYSDVNATASSSPSVAEPYVETNSALTIFSYAGSIVGYLGRGKLTNATSNNVISVSGGSVGLAFGGVGENSVARNIIVNCNPSATIRAYQYGGLVAGEVSGVLEQSIVNGSQDMLKIFAVVPKAAIAVGGITGLLYGGTVRDAVMNQGFKTENDDSGNVIKYLGGIVGLVNSDENKVSTIQRAIISADLSSCTMLGGAIGYVQSILDASEIAVKSSQLSVIGERVSPILGGIVGAVDNECKKISLSHSYCTAKLILDTYTAGISSYPQVSGLIGKQVDKRPADASLKDFILEMEFNYSTSTIEATIQDIREVGVLSTYKFTDTQGDADKQFTHKVLDKNYYDNAFNNVFFMGAKDEKDLSSFITYNFKEYRAIENGLILSANYFGTNQIQTSLVGDRLQSFYGLYGNEYDFYDAGSHFRLKYNPITNQYLRVDAFESLNEKFDDNGLEIASSSANMSALVVQGKTTTGTLYGVSNVTWFEHYYYDNEDAVAIYSEDAAGTCTITIGEDTYTKDASGEFKNGGTVLDASKLMCRKELAISYYYKTDPNDSSKLVNNDNVNDKIKITNMVKTELYIDANNQVWEKCYNDSGDICYKNNLDYKTFEELNQARPIWATSSQQLSYLAFEDDIWWA